MGLARKKRLILVDMDGTIADFNKRALERLAATGARAGVAAGSLAKRYDDMLRFPLVDNFVGDEAAIGALKAAMVAEGFFSRLEPIEGAVVALKEMLAEPTLDVYICTAPLSKSPRCAAEKIEWVRENLGQEWVERLVITRDKSLVRGDVLIDDAPDAKAAALPPTWEQVWFTQPHNLNCVGRRRLVRWADWRAVIMRGEGGGAASGYYGDPASALRVPLWAATAVAAVAAAGFAVWSRQIAA